MRGIGIGLALVLGAGCGAPAPERVGASEQGFVNAVGTQLETSIDLSNRRFGDAIATDGESVLALAVGMDATDGAVALFGREGDGWPERAVFGPPEPSSMLGAAIAVDGDTLAIGDVDVVIYRGSGGQWSQEALLSGEFLHVSFGTALDLDGDWLAVGDAESITDDSAYLFERVGANWTERAHVTPDTGIDMQFGAAVALEGDVFVVGAPGPVVPGLEGPLGEAYVYRLQAGSWVPVQKLAASTPVPGDRFGEALALVGGLLFVGAWRGGDFGTISVYEDAAGSFVETAVVTAKKGGVSFGDAIGFDGTTLLGTTSNVDSTGAVESFTREGSAWVPGPLISELTLPVGADFGAALALSKGVAAVGSPGASVAYVYQLLEGKSCSADGTSVVEANGSSTPCAPYFCSAGACATSCTSSNECSVGFVCDTSLGQGQCISQSQAGQASGDDGGCAMATPSGSRGAFVWLLGLALLLGFVAKRGSA
jgi:hypothetical protein